MVTWSHRLEEKINQFYILQFYSINKCLLLHFYLFLHPQHFLYFFFDPQLQRSLGFCFFVLDLFSSVVFLLSSVGSSFVSPVEGSNLTNLLCSGLCAFQCAW